MNCVESKRGNISPQVNKWKQKVSKCIVRNERVSSREKAKSVIVFKKNINITYKYKNIYL